MDVRTRDRRSTGGRVASALATLVLLAASVLALEPDVAQATYPGNDGLLAFAEITDTGCESSQPGDIKVMNPDGSGVRHLTDGKHPAWSPDGDRLAFDDGSASYVVKADGTGRTYVGAGTSPSWSPDGTKLVMSDGTSLYIRPVAGGASTRLTTPSSTTPFWTGTGEDGRHFEVYADSDYFPSWSPTGDWIVFSRSRHGWVWAANGYQFASLSGISLFKVHPDGTGVAQITGTMPLDLPVYASGEPQGIDYFGRFSANGGEVVYANGQSYPTGWQVYRAPIGGGGRTAVTTLGYPQNDDYVYPAFGPKGGIAFTHSIDMQHGGVFLADQSLNGKQLYAAAGKLVCGLDWAVERTNQDPVSHFNEVQDDANLLTYHFTGNTSYDPDGVITTFEWDFGDGTTDTGNVAHHTYGTPGVYDVVLTVTDDRGASAESDLRLLAGARLEIATTAPVPDEVAVGDEVGIPVLVRNTGLLDLGLVQPWSYFDGAGYAEEAGVDPAPRTVAAGQGQAFTVKVRGVDPGKGTYWIGAQGDSLTGTPARVYEKAIASTPLEVVAATPKLEAKVTPAGGGTPITSVDGVAKGEIWPGDAVELHGTKWDPNGSNVDVTQGDRSLGAFPPPELTTDTTLDPFPATKVGAADACTMTFQGSQDGTTASVKVVGVPMLSTEAAEGAVQHGNGQTVHTGDVLCAPTGPTMPTSGSSRFVGTSLLAPDSLTRMEEFGGGWVATTGSRNLEIRGGIAGDVDLSQGGKAQSFAFPKATPQIPAGASILKALTAAHLSIRKNASISTFRIPQQVNGQTQWVSARRSLVALDGLSLTGCNTAVGVSGVQVDGDVVLTGSISGSGIIMATGNIWIDAHGTLDPCGLSLVAGGRVVIGDVPDVTHLLEPATAGQRTLQVAATDGFAPGDHVVVNPGGTNEEQAVVSALGSIDLVGPLAFDHEAGEQIVDADHRPDGYPLTGDLFHPLDAPKRILDSRPPPEQVGPYGTPWGAGTARDVAVAGGTTGVPADATAVVLNVTVTGTTAPSFLTLWPKGAPAQPTASNLNWAAGQTIPNAVTVKVGDDGKVAVYNNSGNANVIVDVVGWYQHDQTGDGYTSTLVPARVLDSRPPPEQVGEHGTPWGPGTERTVPIAGRGGVPADAEAVVLNATVTGTTAESFLTLYSTGAPGGRPTASNLNWKAGQTIPNAVTVKLGDGGAISVFNNSGNTNVILDVVGWFAPGTGDRFHPVDPIRFQDSRPPPEQVGAYSTPWAAATARTVAVTTRGAVPDDAHAVLANVTVTGTTAESFLTVWNAGAARPTASSLNWRAGVTIANAVTARVGDGDAISAYNNSGSVQVIADAAGWYG